MCLCKFGQNPPIGSGDRHYAKEPFYRAKEPFYSVIPSSKVTKIALEALAYLSRDMTKPTK